MAFNLKCLFKFFKKDQTVKPVSDFMNFRQDKIQSSVGTMVEAPEQTCVVFNVNNICERESNGQIQLNCDLRIKSKKNRETA
jgi:hypothetical protein